MRVKVGTTMSVQFKLRLEESLVSALETASTNYGRRSAQQVAEEILTMYLSFWEQMEQVKVNKYEEQKRQIEKEMEMIWAERTSPLKGKKGAKKARPSGSR